MRFVLHVIVSLLLGAGAHAQDLSRYQLVMLGDSLTAGFGVAREDALPVQVQAELRALGRGDIEIVNAGVSGDTSGDALRRFGFSVGPEADGVLIALGGNDILQGREPAELEETLVALIARARERELDVLLAGVSAPDNLGARVQAYAAAFASAADATGAPFLSDMLAPLAADRGYFQPDGIHPTADGAELMADPIARFIDAALPRD